MTARFASRRRALAAAIVLAVLAVAATIAFWPRPGAAPVAADHAQHASSTPTASPSGTAEPSDVTDVGADTPVGGSGETSLLDAAGTPQADRRDGPPSGTPNTPVDPSTLLRGDAFGGCTPEYGTNGQCLPVYPPSLAGHVQDMLDAGLDPQTMPHNWTCAELRQYFPVGIAVRQPGIDPQALDDDGDAMACEPEPEESMTPGPEH